MESEIRTLYRSEVAKTDDDFGYVVIGSGFLYNMVRVLVAFLIEVGKGRHEVLDVSRLLESKNRKNVPFTVPAEELYLEEVYLDENELLGDLGNDIKIHRKKSLQND